ncbi:UdgX family uracil-DNA binding protein [Ensifer sp. ENS12]|uniref:UdgX family uracil-DNA binding protein n=1 Tax=Ensifer sp. ENS12 TaxID=2854774 RepID=UPI000DDE9AD9|nr:UdgX family uracil-DNA binding protein [Ensifer sp. ENS12]MBV7521500.1 UdgX family uracil-DNA binding protein [Ensifer sp. ENS12]
MATTRNSPEHSATQGPALENPHMSGLSLGDIRQQAEDCRRCDLYKHATQLVFGAGPENAKLMLVGEQPGDKEDLAGKPFVGPAGTVLTECLEEAGIEREACYLTNAVKHFKYEQRGKRRLHSKPNAGEVQRCSWWLGAELARLRPAVVVALGATAAGALLGRSIRVTKDRGRPLEVGSRFLIVVTIHPSYLLRIRDRLNANREREHFVADLRLANELLSGKIEPAARRQTR